VNRVAAIYDIHGNLPALEAVLEDVHGARVDSVIVGGDVIPGPMPRETLGRLLNLDLPAQFIQGNCELAVLAQMAAARTGRVTYWGTASGAPLPKPLQEVMRWTAEQIPEYEGLLASWPRTLRLEIPGLGEALFCHGTPRSETEIFTRLTPEENILPAFDGIDTPLVVCGHTHMQFDRMIARIRVVNAGSAGMPFGEPGADWLLLGPEVELRHTAYDLADAARLIQDTRYPQAEDFAVNNVLKPPSEREMLEAFTRGSA
jgi:predicted phosphodiesterase